MKITALHLPERSVTNIISILKANNMPPKIPNAIHFNCWSFTAFYCGWKERVYWMKGEEMEDELKLRTIPIGRENLKAGDIAVFRRRSILTHTAVLLPGGKLVCHKPGGLDLCIDTMESAVNSYGNVTYARAIVEEKEEEVEA